MIIIVIYNIVIIVIYNIVIIVIYNSNTLKQTSTEACFLTTIVGP
jgi:hypothetical protein